MAELALNISLHPAQRKVFDSKARFRVVVAGRRFGKSWLALAETLMAALDKRNVQKLPCFIVAPTYPAARTIYWKRLHDMAGRLVANSNVNLGVVELVNGVEVHVKGADRPDSLRGVGLWFAVIDEYADQKPEVYELIVGPALSDATLHGGGRCLFIGTPKGRNAFYTLAETARENATGEWELFEFTSADNPFIPAKEIESAKARMSSAAFRQEFLANFESTGGAVFKREWFKTGVEPAEGDWYILADFAGFADTSRADHRLLKDDYRRDETALVVVKVAGERWHVKEIVHGRWGVADTARKLAMLAVQYRPRAIGAERGVLKKAVEPYLREELLRRGVMTPISELTHGNQSKADRIAWALQGRLEHGLVTWEAGARWVDTLEDQLVNFPSVTVHDDLVDALSYTAQLVAGALPGWSPELTSALPEFKKWEPVDEAVGY